jgi:exopolyphosphatase/guanosine-5'-triphosphate,3'-diphosphate pyrophosphatase
MVSKSVGVSVSDIMGGVTDNNIAIIDLGSNSCRMVVFAVQPQRAFRLVDQVSERVRIGEGAFADTRLRAEPMARTVKLLKMYRGLCDANHIQRLVAVGTSAVRDAANRAEFLELVRRGAGLELRVLSGTEEAYYAYLGAINSLPVSDGLVADLGGGSLELMQVRNRLPVASVTLPLGAVRLSERFWHDDPIAPRDERALIERIDEELGKVSWLRAKPAEKLVMVGGTARALANMDKETRELPVDRLHGYELPYEFVHERMKALLKSSSKEREAMEGINSERADIIPAGVAVLSRLLKHTGVQSALVSGQGLREGLFYEEFLLNMGGAARSSFPPCPAELGLPASIAHVALVPNVRALGIANVGFRYQVEWPHATQVCRLALSLFDQLQPLHEYGGAEREFLGAAAILHDIGVAVDYYRHHRHSAYLIENADLPGFSHREIALIALLVRWHRQGTPKLESYGTFLGPEDRERLRKLAAILRLAEDLERSRLQTVMAVRCAISGSSITVEALTRRSADAELWAANHNDELFRKVFERDLRVTAAASDQPSSEEVLAEPVDLLERARQLAQLIGASG